MNGQDLSTHVIPDDLLAIRQPQVLLLEDEAALGANIQQLLETEGYHVTHVRNGAEGLRILLKKEFHVIICDMVMPHCPGDMFYTAVKHARPQLCERFVFMTGHWADRRIDQFIRVVRGLMLWKPFAAHELLRVIQQVLRKVEVSEAEQICALRKVPHRHSSAIGVGGEALRSRDSLTIHGSVSQSHPACRAGHRGGGTSTSQAHVRHALDQCLPLARR